MLHRKIIRYDGTEDNYVEKLKYAMLYTEDKTIITKLAISEDENIALHFNTNPDVFNKLLERGNKQENKDAFDRLYTHKADIESALDASLQQNRGNDIKSSKVFVQLSNISIENKTDWLQIANFHAEWTKKFYDVIVPHINL